MGAPSPTSPFKLSEVTKFENIPHPEDSEEEAEEEAAEEDAVVEGATSPPPACPPLRRSENSARELRKALLMGVLAVDEDEDEMVPWPCAWPPRGGAPLGGLQSVTYDTYSYG